MLIHLHKTNSLNADRHRIEFAEIHNVRLRAELLALEVTKVDHDSTMHERCAINFNNLIRRADCQLIYHSERL